MPQNIDDWKHLVNGTYAQPQPERVVTDEVRKAFDIHNQRVGTIATRDTRSVREAIRRAHFENDHSAYGSATCVILNGHPLSGKTHAALFCAFSETREIWGALSHEPDDPQHDRCIPWIYVEVPKLARGLSLLKAIWTFCGCPPLRQGASSADYLEAIRKLAPRIGLRGIIIDDGHGIGVRQSKESRLLADILKGLITGLPATIVLVGTGFHESGVLHGSAGEQVRLRGACWIDIGQWGLPKPGKVGDWERLGLGLTQRLMLPSSKGVVHLTKRRVLHRLVDGSQHRPGLAVIWAKRAASYAIWHDTDLALDALNATHAGLPMGDNA